MNWNVIIAIGQRSRWAYMIKSHVNNLGVTMLNNYWGYTLLGDSWFIQITTHTTFVTVEPMRVWRWNSEIILLRVTIQQRGRRRDAEILIGWITIRLRYWGICRTRLRFWGVWRSGNRNKIDSEHLNQIYLLLLANTDYESNFFSILFEKWSTEKTYLIT